MSRTQKANENLEKWFGGETFTNGYTDAEFESIAKNFLWGDVSEHGGLSDKQRAIVILTTLTASGTYEVLEKYASAALRAGVSANEIRGNADPVYSVRWNGKGKSCAQRSV